jgi:hypothetical protein|tara:strand:- start:1323 stop:1529 length:207 start_codon:yes stop_codon:yes gene_type:complete
MAPGVTHPLHKPKPAVDSGKCPGVKAEIHHPVEMPVGGIVWIGGPVPAERHGMTPRNFIDFDVLQSVG